MKKVLLIAAIVMFAASAMFTVSSCRNKAKKAEAELEQQVADKVEELVEDVEISTKWTNNDYTKLVPKPEMEVIAAGESELGYSASFSNATVEQVKNYVAKLKDAGFTVNAFENDGEIYSYPAQNADGYSVAITFAQGQSGIVIAKPM